MLLAAGALLKNVNKDDRARKLYSYFSLFGLGLFFFAEVLAATSFSTLAKNLSTISPRALSKLELLASLMHSCSSVGFISSYGAEGTASTSCSSASSSWLS